MLPLASSSYFRRELIRYYYRSSRKILESLHTYFPYIEGFRLRCICEDEIKDELRKIGNASFLFLLLIVAVKKYEGRGKLYHLVRFNWRLSPLANLAAEPRVYRVRKLMSTSILTVSPISGFYFS